MTPEHYAAILDRDAALRRAEMAESDRERLTTEVIKLRVALACYTDATVVSSWGNEELADYGYIARATLGYSGHTPECEWPESALCTCGLEERIVTDMELINEKLLPFTVKGTPE